MNLAVGKCRQKNHNVRAVICTKRKTAERLLSKNTCLDARALASNLAVIYMQRSKSLPLRNKLIACHVLSESVFMLYEFLYLRVKQVFPKAYLLYAMTDSLVIRIPNASDCMEKLKSMSDSLDFSSIPANEALYNTDKMSDAGVWRFEAFYVKQFLSLRQKSYSVLEKNISCSHPSSESCANCSICKGIRKQKINHATYLQVLNNEHSGSFSYDYLSVVNGEISRSESSRKFLSRSDGNRVWIRDSLSMPKGHYSLRI